MAHMIHATRMENMTQVQVGVRLLLSGLTGIQFREGALVGPKKVINRVNAVGT